MKNFSGKILFLDRSDINTDEIIPARYLTENTRDALEPHLLEDLVLEGFDCSRDIEGKSAIITRSNFGCGSSREHAPWALEVNNINLVIAENFARIFRQNMYNCGMLAVELPADIIDRLFSDFSGDSVFVETDIEKQVFHITSGDKKESISFKMNEYDESLIHAGGWVNLADSRY